MPKVFKIFIGLSVSLLIILFAIYLFLKYQVTKSFPDYEGNKEFYNLINDVEIYRDNFGIPFINAKNENELWFAVGYTQAQDRLWQMDLNRRTMQGRLSEIFGRDAIEFDRLFRTLDILSTVKETEKILPDEVYSALVSYTNGINTYITENKGKYPVEFDILNYEPEPWELEHTLLISRLMAWHLNFSWYTELVKWKILTNLGQQKTQELFVEYPVDAPAVISNIVSQQKIPRSISFFINTLKKYYEYFNIYSAGVGSNCWVVDGTKSLSGKPILANDPHLTLPIPNHWYEMNISTPEFVAGGFCFPGTPFIIIGHNNKIAWGLTNAMIDESDFFITKVDSLDTNRYLYNKKSLPIQSRNEIIYIGKRDSILFNVRKTHIGPIVNSVHSSARNLKYEPDTLLLSLKWVGLQPTLETYTFYLLNKSNSREDFLKALSYYSVPSQNFLYADVDGDIGYALAGKIPIRGKYDPTLPDDVSSTSADWIGFIPFDELPKIWNPDQNFIASANNKIISSSKYYFTDMYMPRYRIERIIQLLNSEEKFSVKDFKNFQNDLLSLHPKKYSELIIELFRDSISSNPAVSKAFEYLKNWDYKNTAYDAATSIFNMFFVKLLHNTFKDELGDELFSEYVFFPAYAINAMDKLISIESDWFDDIRTDNVETKNIIIKKSFLDAIEELSLNYGKDIKNWQWGNIHSLTLKHPLGRIEPLNSVFNLGPYKIGGSSSTVNNSEIDFSKPFEALVGPSLRFIIDLSNPDKRYCVIAGGQSGQAFNAHYDDQISLWLNGQYREVEIYRSMSEDFKWKKLTLSPKRR